MIYKFLRYSFVAVFFMVLASCIYALLFGMGTYEGALKYSARKMEIPLSSYYTNYTKHPSENIYKDSSGQDLLERSHNILPNIYSVSG